jgi:hypothetical protein
MTLRLGTLYETKIKEIFNDYESAMKYKLFMTSRYGRKMYYFQKKKHDNFKILLIFFF